jgi:type II secretory pathway pseudopilin PulG
MNRNGFTFLTAIFMVMIMGIMLGLTGQSWKTIMKREREKELLFRGSQIKEAIENWNNPKYTVPGVAPKAAVHPLNDLKDLLQDPYTLTPLRYLPHHYATELDGKNPKCAPDCPKLKIYQDPMTGKEWTYIRGTLDPTSGAITPNAAAGIIGVASKSDEEPLRTNFKDTALENMGTAALGTLTDVTGTINLEKATIGAPPTTTGTVGKMTKYSEWKFIAESAVKNDHSKIYRAYHEGW